MKKDSFELPKSFLTSLDEFTNGYFLVTLNEKNQFKVYLNYNGQESIELAMINFVDIYATSVQESIRQKAIEDILKEDAEEEDD